MRRAGASPESELCDREVEHELRWLVEQVHESRREVARRYLLDEEPQKQIAADLVSLAAGLGRTEVDAPPPPEEPTARQAYPFEPIVPAWAEREREWMPSRGAPPRAPDTRGQAAHEVHRDRVARAYLARAHVALYRDGDPTAARAALALYEDAFPEDPFPAQHTRRAILSILVDRFGRVTGP